MFIPILPLHYFKGAIGWNGGYHGIIFYVSFAGSLIGYYYSDYNETVDNKDPIYDLHGFVHEETSYFPFSEAHVEHKNRLIEHIMELFHVFTQFDNTYANFKIDQIQVKNGFFKNIDLFQALFDVDIHGVI